MPQYQNVGTDGFKYSPEAMAAILKDYYTQQHETTLLRKPCFIDLLPKETGMVGNVYDFTIQHGVGGGISSKDYKAWDNATEQPRSRFRVDMIDTYGAAKLHVKDIVATRNDRGSYVKLLQRQGRDLYTAFFKTICNQAVKASTEAKGVVASVATVGGLTEVTLTAANSAREFEIEEILAYGAPGAAQEDVARVIKVDSVSNTITLADPTDDAAAPATALAAADELYLDGNWQNSTIIGSGTGESVKLAGLADWIPLVAPVAGESFFGVDRSVDPTRLAGHRANMVTLGITSPFRQIQRLSTLMYTDGAEGDFTVICSPAFAEALNLEIGAQGANAQYLPHQESLKVQRGSATVHFKTLSIQTALGLVRVLPEVRIPENRFYIVDSSSWKHVSMGEVPSMFDFGNGVTQSTERTQNLTIRNYAFHNIVCEMPSNNGVAQIA